MALNLEEARKLVARITGKTDDEVQAMFDADDAETQVETTLKAHIKKTADDRAKSEKVGLTKQLLSKAKKSIEDFDLAEDGATAVSILDAALEAVKAKPAGELTVETLTEADLAKNPLYKAVVAERATLKKEIDTTKKNFDKSVSAAVNKHKLRTDAMAKLAELGAEFPKSESLKKVVQDEIAKQLDGLEAVTDDDGAVTYFENGKALVDDSGASLDLGGVVTKISGGLIEFGGGNGGSGTPGTSRKDPTKPAPGKFVHFKGTPPKDYAEALPLLRSPDLTKEAKDEISSYLAANDK